jgi:hypothetical protein
MRDAHQLGPFVGRVIQRYPLSALGVTFVIAGMLGVSVNPEWTYATSSGWALWMHMTGGVNGVDDWEPLRITTVTEQECNAMRDELVLPTLAYLQGKYERSSVTVQLEGRTIVVRWTDANGRHVTSQTQHECRPVGMDPRRSGVK